jgi:hypothetical protein
MNMVRAQSGYLVGFEDMENEIVKMIKSSYKNSNELYNKIEVLSREFSYLSKEVNLKIDRKMQKVRNETKGALK